MPNNSQWPIIKLGDVANEITVGFVGPMANEYLPTGVPFLRSQNVEPYRINMSELTYISETFHHKIRKSSLKPGDVVIVRTGRPGLCAVIPQSLPRSNCSDLIIIRSGENLDPQFLCYYINAAAQEHISAYVVGAVQQHYNVGSAKAMKIPLPPLHTQRAIARILGALDDKIDLNRRMNRTLEAMAQALFKSWFVDFDPVTARAEGRQPFGMDEETARLFPGSFITGTDDTFPQLPAGWRLESLANIARFENGLALQKFRPKENEFLPAIKIRELRQGYADESSEKASPNINSAYIIDDGDVVFSWSGSLLVDLWCGGKGALNQHLFKVTSQTCPKWFFYHWIKFHLPEFQEIAAGKATTMGHIQRHHLESARVVIPDQSCLHIADKVVSPMVELVIKNRIEARTLANLRDTLLPRLLSGELRVRAAEEIIEQIND